MKRRLIWLTLLLVVSLSGLCWTLRPRDPPPAPPLWPSPVWQRVSIDIDQQPFDDALDQLRREFHLEFDVDPTTLNRSFRVTWRAEQATLYAAIASLAAQVQLEPMLQPSGVIRLVSMLRSESSLQFHSLAGLTGLREPLDERDLRIATPMLDRFDGHRRFELTNDPFLRPVPGGVLANLPQSENDQLQELAAGSLAKIMIPNDVIQVVPVAWRDEIRVYPLANLLVESRTSISELTATLGAAPISLRCEALGEALAVRGSLLDHLWIEDVLRQMRASRSPTTVRDALPVHKPYRLVGGMPLCTSPSWRRCSPQSCGATATFARCSRWPSVWKTPTTPTAKPSFALSANWRRTSENHERIKYEPRHGLFGYLSVARR